MWNLICVTPGCLLCSRLELKTSDQVAYGKFIFSVLFFLMACWRGRCLTVVTLATPWMAMHTGSIDSCMASVTISTSLCHLCFLFFSWCRFFFFYSEWNLGEVKSVLNHHLSVVQPTGGMLSIALKRSATRKQINTETLFVLEWCNGFPWLFYI